MNIFSDIIKYMDTIEDKPLKKETLTIASVHNELVEIKKDITYLIELLKFYEPILDEINSKIQKKQKIKNIFLKE